MWPRRWKSPRCCWTARRDIDFQLKAFPPYRLLGPDRGGDSLLTTGSTPLLRAAKACDVPAAKLLLDRKAQGGSGRTA